MSRGMSTQDAEWYFGMTFSDMRRRFVLTPKQGEERGTERERERAPAAMPTWKEIMQGS